MPLKRSRVTKGLLALTITAAVGLTGFAVAPAMAHQSANSSVSSSTTGIFSDTLSPKIFADADRVPVELGVRFSPQESGEVTALQYYQGHKAKDVTTATLWSSSGKALARVKFDATAKVGWRTIALEAPVALKAGSSYVVSYHAPKGGYVLTENDLTKAKSLNGFSLRAGAGVYRYSKVSAMPTQSYRGSNYLVDIVFAPKNGAVDPAPNPPTEPEPQPTPPTDPAPTPTPEPTPPTEPKPEAPMIPLEPAIPAPPTSSKGFPTATNTGLPAGWTPKNEVTGDYWIRTPGAVVEDLRVINGTIHVQAPNVTLRRIDAPNTNVTNYVGGSCQNGLVIEDSRFITNGHTTDKDEPVIAPGGYTVRNIMIDGAPEGLRVGGKSAGCGPVTVQDTFVRATSPQTCSDWHGDGIQGYDGAALVVRNSTVLLRETNNCYGTAAFFYPSGQGNTSIDIDGLMVGGGGYPFRSGMPGTVKNLKVIEKNWGYGPTLVECSPISAWQADVVRLDAAGQPVTVRGISCQ